MKPIREIIIREYMPGSYEAEYEGRLMLLPSREQMWGYLREMFGEISDPDDLAKIRDLEQEIDSLEDEVKRAEVKV